MPWNKGRFIGPKPPLTPKQVLAICLHLQREQRLRDLALFDLAIDGKLRGCDLVRLTIGHLVVNGAARHRVTVIQRKTEQPVRFELTDEARESVLAWLELRGGTLDNDVSPSRSRKGQHLSTRQYARLLGEWVEAIGLGRSAYGTHSMRRTKVAFIYKRTGNLRAVQILLDHTKPESTVRYLGVGAEDALTPSEATEI
ncbi:tyrosine-type recombinase/integrase [Muricoccus vinaceus]|uniref:Tyrosine-type recombinase/integrase n=1 Tax=Muricoccus vinaceus TaxID=424704 RepID=A0ABV6J1G4_9PROT